MSPAQLDNIIRLQLAIAELERDQGAQEKLLVEFFRRLLAEEIEAAREAA